MSLIELMIAILIGSIMLLALVQVFGASRSAYQLSEGMARAQENGRFAIDFLQRDIRMAGHFGCVNDQARRQTDDTLRSHFADDGPLDFRYSIRGYENAAPAGITLLPERIDGTDTVVLRFLSGHGVPVTNVDPASGEISFDAAKWGVLAEGVANPVLFGIADCAFADVFQADAAGSSGIEAPNVVDLGRYGVSPDGGPAMVYRAEAVVYYVGEGAGGQPSLWRARVGAGGVTSSEELVEGVENMQFRYGMDSSGALDPSGYVSVQGSASDVGNTELAWRGVGQVQVALLAASPNAAASLQATTPPSLLGVTPTLPTDGRYRGVYETTIALRNRLYGN